MALTRYNINVGTSPNDGQGDPIRTAFELTNDNFVELFSIPNPTPPTTLIGKNGDVPGMYAYDTQYFYYCFATWTGSTTIWAKVPQLNTISIPIISNGNSNVVVSANSNITVGVGGTSNVVTFTTDGIVVPGNIDVNIVNADFLRGDGSNITGGYSNANVAAYLPTYSGNVNATRVLVTDFLSATGNVRGGNINTIGNVTGNYFIGNGAYLTGMYSNSNVSSYLPTYTGSLPALTGDVNTIGNISAQGTINSTGNIHTDGYFVGTFLGNVSGNITAAGSNTQILFNGSGNVAAAGGLTFDTDGPNLLTVLGTISAQSNVRAGNMVASNFTYPNGISIINNYSNANVGNYLITNTGNIAAGNISVTGYLYGNGASLTGLPVTYSNANVASYLATYSGNISTSGNIYAATANIGSNTTQVATTAFVTAAVQIAGGYGNAEVEELLASDNITSNITTTGGEIYTTTGNIFSISGDTGTINGFLRGNGYYIGNIQASNVDGTVANATYATSAGSSTTAGTVINSAQGNITSVGTLGNLIVSGTITVNSSALDTAIINGAANNTGNIGSAGNAFGSVFANIFYGNTFNGTATTAVYADLAEHYLADTKYTPGTVVSFGGSQEITQSTQELDTTVAGIISTNPAYLMNSGLQGEHVAAVALQGRVPCRVTGAVTPGAMMVSNGDGTARAERNPVIGSVLGKALESFEGETGTIEVVVGRL